MSKNVNRNPRVTAGLLVLVFIVPVLIAHLLYQYRENISFKTVEAGILLSPPLAAHSFEFFDSAHLGKLQLVYLTSTNVNLPSVLETKPSQKALSILNGIHTALGKEKNRVEYRVLFAKNMPVTLDENFVIIDPKGWIIMRYPSNSAPQGILRDIRRLLKVSHGG